ncbi:MAG TPA: ABC transporter substrate binding protein, partial [Rhodocyclaceae bacterium]
VFDRVLRGASVRASALFLGQSFARQLAVVRKAFPDTRRVGVLAGPESAQAIPLLEKAAREAGLSLLVERSDGGRLHGALRSIIASAHVLLVLPDPQVFNASSIQGILLETYRAKIPLIGISSAYTRAGAALSLSVSPVQLGSETARLVRQVIEGDLPSPRYSEAAEVHVNRQVVRSLGLNLPTDESLLSAARGVP